MMTKHRPNQRTPRKGVTVAVVAAALAGTAACVTVGFDAWSDAHREQAQADRIEMIEMRAALRRVLLDDVNTQMLAQFDVRGRDDVADAAAARVNRIREVRARLGDLVRSDDTAVRNEALAIIEVIDREELRVPRDADPIVLYDGTWEVLGAGAPSAGQALEAILALGDLMTTDSTGAYVLNDSLDAAYTMSAPDVPEHMAEYVSRSEPYIRSRAGYLGEDPDAPFTDSYVFEPVANERRPEVADIEARVAASRLWTFDQWMRSWADGDPGDPPMTLDELADEAAAVDDDARAVVDATLADARRTHERAASSALRTEIIAFLAAGILLLALVGTVVATMRRRWRTIRLAAAQGGIDQLTGVANRYRLDHLERLVDASPDDVHLVAAVDLDGFKHINDRFGHRAGDAVLVEIARRLQDIVLRRSTDGAVSGSVVRMGGDEFVLTLHSWIDLDVDAVRAELDAIRTSTIELDDELVELRFSTGLAHARGVSSLQDLLDAADLACYDDKASRRQSAGRRRAEGLQSAASD